MESRQQLPATSSASYFTNPLYSPATDDGDANADALSENHQDKLLPTRPSNLNLLDASLLVSATAQHQEAIFDIQLDNCIDESAAAAAASESQQANDQNGRKSGSTGNASPPLPPSSVSAVAAEWDRAVSSGEKDLDTGHSEWPLQLLKMVVYNATFVLILSLAVSVKAITLLMTSMIAADRPLKLCINNVTAPTMNPPIFPLNEALSGNASSPIYASFSLRYEPASLQRIAWLWALLFATSAPYFFSYFRSLRICFFRNFAVPQRATILTVSGGGGYGGNILTQKF